MAVENKAEAVFSPTHSLGHSRSYDEKCRVFKIIVLGDAHVGKTCLTYRFCGGYFRENSKATIGVDFREKTLELDGESIKLQIWDTAGQERFRTSMVEQYYRNVQAVIFVYDITSLSSFKKIPEWIDECSRHCVGPLVPRILVGTKCDMQGQRQVLTHTAQSFADAHRFPLFETSAKEPSEKEHIDAIFLTLAHRLKSCKSLILKQPSVEGVAPLLEQRNQEPKKCCRW